MTHPIHQNQFRVISAGKDIGPIYLLSQKADWNQTKEDLKLLAAQNPLANLLAVAEINGANSPLGSGLVLNVGESLAWIGMILVHQDHRRKGIASAIMEECIEVARLAMDKSIVGLDATPAGLQVYKNIGFRESFKLWRCKLNTDTTIERDKAVKITSLSSIDEHSNFLRAVKLDKKLAGLRLIHKMYPEGSFLAEIQGEPCGIAMSRPGRLKPFIGPLIANSADVARKLLGYLLNYWKGKDCGGVFIDIPENHFESASRWESEMKCATPPADCVLDPEIRPARGLVRMYELISEDNYARLLTRSEEGNKHLRSKKALKSGNAAYDATLDYMKQEIEALQYIYAAGGPELS